MANKGAHPMKKRILVADDNEDSAGAMAMMFKLMDNEVRIAQNGTEAISIAEEFRPDLILLDVAMPDVDGYEVCQHIRQQTWGAEVTLAALTGWVGKQYEDRAIEAGFDHFLAKSIKTGALEQLLAGTLEREKGRDQ